MSDIQNPAQIAQTALGGIQEAIKVGREIRSTSKDVNNFLDEEARARVAWKKKQLQLQRRGDLVFIDAGEEYRELRKIRAAEELMYKEVERDFGKDAVSEVKTLVTQMRKERKILDYEFQKARYEERLLWLIIFSISGTLYLILKLSKVI